MLSLIGIRIAGFINILLAGAGVAITTNRLLKEDGDGLLLEIGNSILIEEE